MPSSYRLSASLGRAEEAVNSSAQPKKNQSYIKRSQNRQPPSFGPHSFCHHLLVPAKMLYNHLFGFCCFLIPLVARIGAARHQTGLSGLVAAAVPAQTSQAKAVAANYLAITGVDTGRDSQTGARPARRNILDLLNDGPSWLVVTHTLNADRPLSQGHPLGRSISKL